MEKLHEEERAVDEEGTNVDKQVSDIKDGIESQVKKNEEFNEEAADEVEKVERSEEEKAEVEHNDVENAGEVGIKTKAGGVATPPSLQQTRLARALAVPVSCSSCKNHPQWKWKIACKLYHRMLERLLPSSCIGG